MFQDSDNSIVLGYPYGKNGASRMYPFKVQAWMIRVFQEAIKYLFSMFLNLNRQFVVIFPKFVCCL